MYTSHTMLILTLLLLLTAALFYNTIDLKKRQIIEEMRATSLDLKSSSVEHVVSSSLSPVFNKVLNDASLEVAMNRTFFDSPEEVVDYLWINTENHIRDYLDSVSEYYSNQGYNFTYSFNITNITMVDGFTFRINYTFSYTLSYNGVINKTESIESFQDVTIKTILDAYHYLKPIYIMPINIYNPNSEDLTDFQVKIILNSSNFNFSIEPNGAGLRFVDENSNFIPYWVEFWNYSNDSINNDKAIIWIKVPKLEAHKNTTVYLLSAYPKTSQSNGDLVFELFDDFEYNSMGTKWNALYRDWNYSMFNDYPLYSNLYNRRVIGCKNAPPVARIISLNDTDLENYIIEVVARGENDYEVWDWDELEWMSYPAPNIMVGYFAHPQYSQETTVHRDAFYTFDLGGRYGKKWWEIQIPALREIKGTDLEWILDIPIINIFASPSFEGIMICKEYFEKELPLLWGLIKLENIVYRNRVVYNDNPLTEPKKGKWYHIKILIINRSKVYGTYTPLKEYINNNENSWIISTTINDPYGSHFLLGTSWGDHDNNKYQHVYFDNFRVRKYAPIEPEVYVSGNFTRIYALIYISPGRAYGTHYGEGVSYNPYFVEDPSGEYPSIVDMLAGRDTREWEYGYSIRPIGYYLPED